ncbi:hypothetical protein RLDS_24795 [Sphingobium lactosutens DS20]|uniref:Uncharacterized protein n=1 Tax=Sphingobium lactosutens DS20 TaxID=1331060 RepID=T0IHD6_9SPHN|nr:hypothetical protein RLDS_24795 [Sphingobium lactosutens DS20]
MKPMLPAFKPHSGSWVLAACAAYPSSPEVTA